MAAEARAYKGNAGKSGIAENLPWQWEYGNQCTPVKAVGYFAMLFSNQTISSSVFIFVDSTANAWFILV